MQQALQSLAVFARAVLVGITDEPLAVDSYRELMGREAQVIDCSDHLLHELTLLIEFVCRGWLDLSGVVTGTVPLDAGAVNEALDDLARFGGGIRTVFTPWRLS
jgi:threonine dehydrogenase-like Zn-dependent dehydrogenase